MEEISSEARKDNKQYKSSDESLFQLLRPQWKIFGEVIGQPSVIFSLIIFIGALGFSYYIDNKNLSLVLSVVSSVFTSIVGAIIFDRYKQISGDTILVKKGQGAVRSLFLIVEKIKNISDVSNKRKNVEEIVNLLSLIEKDVTNSIQEWTDIIPSLADIEIFQKIIEEKESEKVRIQAQYDEANKKYKEEVDATNKETEEQKVKIVELNKILEDTKRDINKLKLERDIAISKNTNRMSNVIGGASGTSGISIGSSRGIRLRDAITRTRNINIDNDDRILK